ncbi:MAG: MCE family protein [Gemmatimonadaceae bacterium]|nr:MCE family protein [Gemmatimonadaceae bacterium]NUO96116.1 MCE family protein [Gemmatimonadaceae bacterium]NUR33319.1 MCE family protein [Gemmatimonadaceae bacterium]NUS31998.1 MCE family protein [Gemmatimonadaceae bacterium]NUS46478.1 MCE family protein [Gemmatimonadaceae bacterium]
MKRSPTITWDQLRVGIVILVALGIIGIAVYKLGQAANLFAKRYQLIAYLPDANGIRTGGAVMVAGQLAGTVKSIEFLPVDADTTRNLRLVLQIDETVKEQIRRDSKGKLRTMGLLGDKAFDITPGTPRARVLQEGDTVTVAPSLDYEAVIAQASGAVTDLVALTRDMRAITGGIVRGQGTVGQLVTNRALYDNLNGTLARANAMLAQFQNPNGTVGRMLNDPTLYNRLTGVIASTDSLVTTLNSTKGTAGLLLRDTTLYRNMVGITRGADSLMRSLTNGQGTASKLLTDQTLYDQLNKLVADLSAVLADVRRDPSRYTKGLVKVF